MRRIITLILALIILPGIAGATKYPLTVKDCRGKTITISREPKRIISLTPATTEILFALGLDSRIAGVTRYCNYPAQAQKKPKIGDRTVSIEKVISLKPDLVVAHSFLNDDGIKSIEAHGFTVVTFNPKTVGQAAADIVTIGRITNQEAQAKKVAGRISSAQALLRKKLAGVKGKPKMIVSVQADPLWAAGPKTFIDEIIRSAGAQNLASDAKPGFNQFSAEAAVWRNPDVIIGTYKGDKKVFTRGLWKDTKAARTGRVYEVNPDLLVRPGPRLADGLLLIARLAHPEIFKGR